MSWQLMIDWSLEGHLAGAGRDEYRAKGSRRRERRGRRTEESSVDPKRVKRGRELPHLGRGGVRSSWMLSVAGFDCGGLESNSRETWLVEVKNCRADSFRSQVHP